MKARSLPYTELTGREYICQRCGIKAPKKHGAKTTHCRDCRPYKRG